jgi:hypothetical protein
MTLCPYALVSSCRKCPIVKVCPLKGVIGDHQPEKPPAKQKAKEDKD